MDNYCKFCGYQLAENTGSCPQCGMQVIGTDTPPQGDFYPQLPYRPAHDPQQNDFFPQQPFQSAQSPDQHNMYVQQPFQPQQDLQGEFNPQQHFQPPQNTNQDSFYPQQPFQPMQNQQYNSFNGQPPFQPVQNSHINTSSLIGFILACASLPIQAGRLSGFFYGETVGFICGIVGIILSVVGLKQIAGTKERGRGFSIAGIIIGSISVLVLAVVFLILFLLFGLSYFF